MSADPATPVYFVEEASPVTGEWRPTLYHGQPPARKRADGPPRRFRRAPVRVHPNDVNDPLCVIWAQYGGDAPSKASFVPPEKQVAEG